jgi:hypothetical protein
MRTPRIAKRSPQRRHVRSLHLEQLESRRLLAANVFDLWPGDPRAAIDLVVTDSRGFPISQVEQGDTFQLQAWTRGFVSRRESGVYATYTDVEFDASLVSATGDIDHGKTFIKGRFGEATPGLLDEVGGYRDFDNGPPLFHPASLGGVLLFNATMTADAIGQVVFSANPADDLPKHETILVGVTLKPDPISDEELLSSKEIYDAHTDRQLNPVPKVTFSTIPTNYVPREGTLLSLDEKPVLDGDVYYGTVRLEIVEPGHLAATPRRNADNPFDINVDGRITPADALAVIKEVGCSEETQTCEHDPVWLTDVNGDGQTTPADIVLVVDQLFVDPPFAGADTYVARLGQPLTISAVDGVLANDFAPEGVAVTASLTSGPAGLELSSDGSFIWTPPEDFVGDQVEFTYSASDGRREAEATARILIHDIDDEVVIVSLRTVDAAGEPITQAAPGETFFLEGYVEDTRPRPTGVFAAYVDVAFDAELASVAGPFTFGTKFANGRHGSAAVPGRLEEVGGFQAPDDYLGGGETLLFSVPLLADGLGDLTFTSEMADTIPDHHVLLLGKSRAIPQDLIQFRSATLEITDRNRAPRAASDRYFGQPGTVLSIPVGDGVLANDHDLDGDSLSSNVVDGPAHGTLALEPNGSFTYTPAANFNGIDSFAYVANDGELDSQVASVELDLRGNGDALVAIRLQAFDANGQAIDHVTVGDEFELRVVTEDLRVIPQGVFAAYTDIEYDAALVSSVGEISFGATYDAGREATHTPGLIDDTGAFTRSHTPIGGGEFTVFSQRFTATSAGQVLFASNPADDLPAHDVLLYGINHEIDPDDIDFGSVTVINVPLEGITFSTLSLRIVAEGEDPTLGVADSIVVPYQAANRELDVLSNDSAAVTAITAVAEAMGSVSIAADGRSLLYSARDNFAGHDRFTYTVTDATGKTEVVAVDVQVKSPYQNFARPTDTDSDGHVAPIDALYGINELNRAGSRRLAAENAKLEGLSVFLDVNGDLHLSPLDVLIIINELNERSALNPEGEASPRRSVDEGDANEELTTPLSVRSDSMTERNTVDTTGWTMVERVPTRREEFFARLVSNDEPLFDFSGPLGRKPSGSSSRNC